METREYRYPANALMKDYFGAVIGLTVFGVPALFVPLSSGMVLLLGGLGLLFAAFALRTAARQASRLLIDADAIRIAGPIGRQIAWNDLRGVRLRFFSTWRDRTSGWMQLGVKGKGTTISIDQSIDDFSEIAEIALSMAVRTGATFDATTLQNARSLGIDLPPEMGDRAE